MKLNIHTLTSIGAALMFLITGSALGTTISGTANGPADPQGNRNKWNLAANWDAGIPSGNVDAVVAAGLSTSAWSSSTPSYTGTLTLLENSTLELGFGNPQHTETLNALGGSGLIMHEGSQLRLRMSQPNPLNLPSIELIGDASVHLSPSTSAHHTTRNFNFQVRGEGALTLIGNNNNTAAINSANTFEGGFVADADDSWRVDADVTGAFGSGDVTLNGRSGVPSRGATLRINAEDTIDDFATLILNGGRDHRLAAKLILNEDETVGAFFLDGVDLGVGTFDANSGLTTANGDALISGSGVLTVTGQTGGAVPEPATATLALLGVGGLVMRRRRNVA